VNRPLDHAESEEMVRTVPLGVDLIVDAAVLIGRREGFDAVSMRGLARHFGVTTMAIHYHVPTKTKLMELMADRVLSTIAPAPTEGEWDERLRTLHRNVSDVLAGFPGINRYLVGQRGIPSVLRLTDTTMSILLDAGFDDETVVLAQATTVSYWMGFLQLRSRFDRKGRESSLRKTTPGEYPALDRVAKTRAALSLEEYPAFAIDTIIAGLRSLLSSDADGGRDRR
jgi:TetR/AcrR family tetracycline transcriptional repressor